MPEWVYVLGWLAVPVALVALSGWWHERDTHREMDTWTRTVWQQYVDLRTINQQLRSALRELERERANLRQGMVDHE